MTTKMQFFPAARLDGRLQRGIALLAAFSVLAACGDPDADEGVDASVDEQPAGATDNRSAAAGNDTREATPREAEASGELSPEQDLFANAEILSPDGGAFGRITFHQRGSEVDIEGKLEGLAPEATVSLQVVDSCDTEASSAARETPESDDTSAPPASGADVSGSVMDALDSLSVDMSGTAEIDQTVSNITLEEGQSGIVGRALVVLADSADNGGGTGNRVGCGDVERDVAPIY